MLKKKCFINPHVKPARRGFKEFLLWKIGYYDDESDIEKKLLKNLTAFHSHFQKEKPSATWINHSTFLVSINNVHLLTDPIWSERCSPIPFLGPKRKHLPGLPLSELPKIDLVLISHDHYDHLDKRTILSLSRKFPHICWFVPKGIKRWFDRHKISPVYEFGWWDELEITLPGQTEFKGKLTAVPAQHFSGRKGYDLNSTLWLGWVMEFDSKNLESKRCYFVGDTGYNPFDFKKIGEKFAPIDLSMIPIGAYSPRSFMETVHISPKEAVLIHKDVGSRLSIAMHWKTFCLSDEPMEDPPYELYQSLLNERIDPSEFIIVTPGHAFNW